MVLAARQVSIFETIQAAADAHNAGGGTACSKAVFSEKIPTPCYPKGLVEVGAAYGLFQPSLANGLPDQLHRFAFTRS